MDSVRTGATKDLARSLRQRNARFLFPISGSQRHLAGPSSFSLIYVIEIFFAILAVGILFQAFIPLSSAPLNFAWWHLVFVAAILFHAAWLIYLGLNREFSTASVAISIYITYGSYLLWPFALHHNAQNASPWCWLIGLYGMVAPLSMGKFRTVMGNVVGYSLALLFALAGGRVAIGAPIEWSEILIKVIYFAALATILGTIFIVARVYAERSDVFYSETLAAQLQLNRTRDQSNDLQEFDKLVHDNVMAALLDASRFEGPIADRTRALATRAIGVLEDETNKVQPMHPITFQELTERVASGVYPWNSRLRFVSDDSEKYPKASPSSTIPPEAARAFTHAVTEAVSNSARHSGTRTTQISVRTELRRPNHPSASTRKVPFIYCTVTDYGQGFNMKNLDLRRMGVRVSMIRSMEEVGGVVHIQSAPYLGTKVTVQWPGDQP